MISPNGKARQRKLGSKLSGAVRIWLAQVFLLVTGLAILLGSTRSAYASEDFPGVLVEELDMPCLPACIVCHKTNQGGSNWRNTLGPLLVLNGALADDSDSLRAALRQIEADPASNAALEPLRRGEDPNGQVDICSATYGCGARVAARGSVDPWGFLAAALFSAALISFLRQRRHI